MAKESHPIGRRRLRVQIIAPKSVRNTLFFAKIKNKKPQRLQIPVFDCFQ
jgi:hypothetical protein